MDNRRQSFRVLPGLRLPTRITRQGGTEPIAGVTVNLSVEGIAVHLEDPRVVLHEGESCTASLSIPGEQANLTMSCTVIHTSVIGGKTAYGLQFLPAADDDTNDSREAVIGRFLLEEQRQHRRKQREAN